MGEMISRCYYIPTVPPTVPFTGSQPTFDPNFGFKHPRKERVSKLSLQEMKALGIPKEHRNYCAHFYRDYQLCYNYYKPIYGLCYPELHALEHCKHEDFILRMKEYERESRLRLREQKLKELKSSA